MGPTGEYTSRSVVSQLAESVKAIFELLECRNAFRNMYGNFVRRVKLLSPLFEELRDTNKPLGEGEVVALESLGEALNSAKPRSFPYIVKQHYWDKAENIKGRDSDRWHHDLLGNTIFRKLVGCPGCLCHDYEKLRRAEPKE
ncbi:hypothetical protein ACFX11_007225 [Malus domestica]